MNWNPLFIKNVRAQLRPNELLPWIATTVLLGVVVTYGTYVFSEAFQHRVSSGVGFMILSGAQTFLLAFGAIFLLAEANRCNLSGIIDFHRISPQRPHSIVLGIYFGAPIRFYLMFAILFPFAMYVGLRAGFELSGLLVFYASLLLTALYGQMLFMTSAYAVTGKRANGVMFSLILAGISFLVLANLGVFDGFNYYAAYRPGIDHYATFFGFSIPKLLIQIFSQASIGIFLFIHTVRSVRNGIGCIYPKLASTLLIGNVIFLMLGALSENFGKGRIVVGLLAFLIFIAIRVATPTRTQYLSGRRLASRLKKKLFPWHDRALNWGLSLAMVGLLFVFIALAKMMNVEFASESEIWKAAALWAMTILQYAFAVQYFKLKFDAKWGIYMWFAIFLFWILPVAIGAIGVQALALSGVIALPGMISAIFAISGPAIAWMFSSVAEASVQENVNIAFLVSTALTGFAFYMCYREYERLKRVE